MEKKYNIIYADPPWSYFSGKVQGAAKNHYNTMADNEIYQLPVGELADEDCVLFLWATFPKLPEALEAIKEWGFKYKTVAFVWIKKNKVSDTMFFGLGRWTRGNAEVCLLAIKGKPKRISAKVFQIIISPLQRHSQKPEEARVRIVELMGNLPKIELFAREKAESWDVWGNEVQSTIELVEKINIQ